MNDADVITDLKQFISAGITQQTSVLSDKFDGLEKRFDGLEKDVTELKEDVVELKTDFNEIRKALHDTAIDYTSEVDDQVQDHEKRITKLERKIA